MRLEEEQLGRLDRLERARDTRAGGERARPLDGVERDRVVGVERVAVGVRDEHVRRGLADPVGDRDERVLVDLERVVAEIEALEGRAERGRRPLRLAVADLLHALDRLPRLLPELARLALLAVREREHVRRAAGRGRDRDRAAGAPDEVGAVRADHEQRPHASPASRREWATIISRTSSSSNAASSSRSAQIASPSSTAG